MPQTVRINSLISLCHRIVPAGCTSHNRVTCMPHLKRATANIASLQYQNTVLLAEQSAFTVVNVHIYCTKSRVYSTCTAIFADSNTIVQLLSRTMPHSRASGTVTQRCHHHCISHHATNRSHNLTNNIVPPKQCYRSAHCTTVSRAFASEACDRKQRIITVPNYCTF